MRLHQSIAQHYWMPLAIVLLVAGVNYGFAFHYPFFVADDWDWLYSGQFSSYRDLAVLWPRAVYNDRPVGALVIKFMYQLFGLRSEAFYLFQLGIHVFNCLLLFWIAKRYISVSGAFLAAVLAGTWVIANDAVIWTAAIFDLFGATLCLLSIYLWQIGRRNQNTWIVILGAIIYFLAIRTKEFAITLPLLIFAMAILLESESWKSALKRIWPYCLVMGALGLWYLQLLLNSPLIGGNDAYGLHIASIWDNLRYYLDTLFYENLWDPSRTVWSKVHLAIVLIAIACLFWGLWTSTNYRKVFLVAMLGFLLMLGPTLLLKNHLGELYLYAPHFFLALAIGGLFSAAPILRWPVAVFISLLILWPLSTKWFQDKAQYFVSNIQNTAQQYTNFQVHLEKMTPGVRIFIANIPDWNAFEYQGGKPLKVRMQDSTLQLRTHLPDDQLVALFCQASTPKIFIRMVGNQVLDESEQVIARCRGQ